MAPRDGVVPPPPPGFQIVGGAVPPPPPGFQMVEPSRSSMAPPVGDEMMDAVFPVGGEVVEPPVTTAERGLQIGVQGVGRGIADIIGAPADLTTLGLNLPLILGEAGVNLFREPEDAVSLPRVTNPVGGGDWIADLASQGAEAVGYDVLDPQAMSTPERLAYNVNRFGTSAGLGAAGLSRAAAGKMAADATRTATPGVADFLLRPYSGPNVARTATADVAGGAGAGAGLTAGEEMFPESEWAQFLSTLGGGLAGNVAGAAAHTPGDIGRALASFAPDPDIPYAPGQMLPTSKRVADTAARVVQTQTSDPAAASARIGERASAARDAGEPMPTAGIASDDIGLIGLERGLRQSPSMDNPALRRQFLERDQALKEGAAEAVGRLTDPDADLDVGLATARDRPKQIAAERDREAIPILARAEASGATIDAQPVADAIDSMLAKAKRPAVVSALKDARRMLNATGSEDLDTTVSGLYETRKAINDLIEGRTETPTGRYAKKELIEVRKALDAAITEEVPEFGEYLAKYQEGSRGLDVFEDSKSVSRMVESDTDLRNTARRLLTGREYGRDQAMSEINSVVGTTPEAKRAWRAAVAEVLSDQVSPSARNDEVSLAQLRRVWDEHHDTLAQVFDPEDMQTLERAHEMLEPLANLHQQTVSGSATIDNSRLAGMVEAAILSATGNAITTGMIMKRMRVAANLIPGFREVSVPYKTARLIERMMFDPDLARQILERPVSEGTGALWNRGLRSLLAEGELSRGLYSEDDEMREAVER